MSELFNSAKIKPQPIKPTIFLGQLLWSAQVARLVHFQTISYSEHKNTESYSNSLVDLTDELVETYFGSLDGNREQIKIPSVEYIHFPAHLKQMRTYIDSNRQIFIGPDLQNIIDEIVGLINKSMYLTKLE